MKIIIDSREQRKLEFGCDFIVKKLDVGDYGCLFSETYQYPTVFERKNCSDLFGSLTQGYDRMRRCFDRANKSNVKMILAIEGTKEKILKGFPHTQRDPESVITQLNTIERKYGITHIFFPSRIAMSHYIVDYYRKAYEDWLEAKKLIDTLKDIE